MFDLSGLYHVLSMSPVPLLSMEVRAEVKNFIAEVELRQKYENKENNPLEVTYFFPVEEEASVIGCKALLDGENCFYLPAFHCKNIQGRRSWPGWRRRRRRRRSTRGR